MLSRVLDPCGTVRIMSWVSDSPLPGRLEQALEIAWPRSVGQVTRGRVEVLCVGPTDWLLIAPDPDAAPLLQMLSEAFEGSPFRATDLSAALARIRIEGVNARTLLAKGCALDLHPRVFRPGCFARTRLAGMPVIVRCTDALAFECLVTLSYGEYMLAWLTDAAAASEFP